MLLELKLAALSSRVSLESPSLKQLLSLQISLLPGLKRFHLKFYAKGWFVELENHRPTMLSHVLL